MTVTEETEGTACPSWCDYGAAFPDGCEVHIGPTETIPLCLVSPKQFEHPVHRTVSWAPAGLEIYLQAEGDRTPVVTMGWADGGGGDFAKLDFGELLELIGVLSNLRDQVYEIAQAKAVPA